MKVIIAGGRNIKGENLLYEALKTFPYKITEVVCGMASGVDTLGKEYAEENGILISEFPANWEKHGKAAGPIRNKQMAEYGDVLLLIWDGKSSGSANMAKQMEMVEKPSVKYLITDLYEQISKKIPDSDWH